MKKLSILFILITTLVACNHHNPNDGDFNDDPSSGYVDFNDSIYIVDSATDTVDVPVTLNSPVNGENLTLTASAKITSGSASGTDIGPVKAVVPSDSLSGNFEIVVNRELGDYDVDLEITETSRSNVKIGLDDGTKFTVVNTNICGELTGAYTTEITIDGTTFNGENVLTFNGNVSENGYCVYDSPALWSSSFVPQLSGDESNDFPYKGALIFNSDDNTFTAVPDEQTNSNPGGTGSYNPDSGVITLQLEQTIFPPSFGVPDVVEVTLTPMPQ